MTSIPAATVILLRDSTRGPEILMVRRRDNLAFAAGALVFPGGRVDDADQLQAVHARPSPPAAPRRQFWRQF
jgi:8-oxo-dGTP pyrophosphatase MutT (NUDIX family)